MGVGLPYFVVRALGWTLVHVLWQVALVALLYRGLEELSRRRSPRLRHAVACGAVMLCLALPAGTAWILAAPGGEAPAATTAAAVASSSGPVAETGRPGRGSAGRLPGSVGVESAGGPDLHAPSGPSADVEGRLERAAGAVAAALEPWLTPWVPALWLLGLGAASIRLAASWCRMGSLRRSGSPSVPEAWRRQLERLRGRLAVESPVRLARSTAVDTPVLLGWRRPLILLPADRALPPRRLEAVLAHELAHVRRRDFPLNLALAVVAALLFFHPALHWLISRVRLEREGACDRLASTACEGGPVAYARELASLEARRIGLPALAAAEGDLMRRVRLLVLPGSIRRRPALGAVACSLAACALILLSSSLLPASGVPTILDGLDPVLLVDGVRTSGSPTLALTWRGYRYRFADAASRQRFRDDPERFAVRNVAACPISGRRVRGDVYRVVEGRIFLFCCHDVPESRLHDADRLEAALVGVRGAG